VNFGLGENQAFFPTMTTNVAAGAQPVRFGLSGVSGLFLNPNGTQGRNSALGELHDTFGWTRGAHQFSFGGDATLIHYNDFFQYGGTVGTLGIDTVNDPAAGDFGNCFSNLGGTCSLPNVSSTQQGNVTQLYGSLVGRVTGFASTAAFNPANKQYQSTVPQVDNVGQFEMGIFGGDSWRIRPNVTFNYGLRWEYSGPPWDKSNQYWMLQNPNDVFGSSGVGNLFHPGSTGGNNNISFVNDAGRSWYNRYLKAFAPSVGVAYQPNWDNGMMHRIFGSAGKTVLRAGFSIAYSREGLNSFFGIAQGNPFTGAQTAVSALTNSAANGQFVAVGDNGSMLVLADGESWVLLNASPDLPAQLAATPALAPGPGLRDTPVRGVLLTDAELDHTLGLLSLRGAPDLRVYAPEPVIDALTEGFPVRGLLDSYAEWSWQPVRAGEPLTVHGLVVIAYPVSGKRPRYAATAAAEHDWVVAYRIEDPVTGGVLVYAPCLASWPDTFDELTAGADAVLLDGTFFTAGELAEQAGRPAPPGPGATTPMGHLPITGPGGSLDRIRERTGVRWIYTHLNNTNPLLDAGSPHRQELAAAGAEVLDDGTELRI